MATSTYWYNGPHNGTVVALVGGPYATRDDAIAARNADTMFAHDTWPAQGTWFMTWYAVEVPRNDYCKQLTCRACPKWEAIRAVRAAADDAEHDRGGYFAGRATPAYLATLATIAAYRATRRAAETEV